MAISLKEIQSQASQWQQFSRTIRRRLPADGSAGPINLPAEVQPKLLQTAGHLSRLLKTMQEWYKAVSTHHQAGGADVESGVPVAKMRELAHAAADIIYMDDYNTGSGDGGFFDCVHSSLSYVGAAFATVSAALVDGHYDFDGSPPSEVSLSIILNFFKLRLIYNFYDVDQAFSCCFTSPKSQG